MKLIFKTARLKTCFVRVPNYFSHDDIPNLVEQLKTVLPLDDNINEETASLHGDDWLTNDELKQLDTDGRIIRPMTEITL